MTLDFTDLQLWNTPQSLLTYRILASIAQDTVIQPLLEKYEANAMKFIPGEPPKDKQPDTPSCYVWFQDDDIAINAQGALGTMRLTGYIKIALSGVTTAKEIPMNTDGTFNEPIPLQEMQHTPLMEVYLLEKRLRNILNVDGYKNNWYYTFVMNGVLGAPNRLRITLLSFVQPDRDMRLHMNCRFQTEVWWHSSEEIAEGAVTISVSDGAAVVGATVWMKDAKGNTIWSSDASYEWESDGSGEVSLSSVISQKGVTVYAEYGALSGNTASQTLSQGGSTITVTIS